MKKTLLLCWLLALPAGSALATDSAWNGTWKLDPAKSHFTGDTLAYTKGPGTMLHYSNGSTSYDFGLDGKEYKTWANRTTTWTAADKNGWEWITKPDHCINSGDVLTPRRPSNATTQFERPVWRRARA